MRDFVEVEGYNTKANAICQENNKECVWNAKTTLPISSWKDYILNQFEMYLDFEVIKIRIKSI